MDEAARARADAAAARRAKILARQKDRLTQITGSYSDAEKTSEELASAQQQPLQGSSEAAPGSIPSTQSAVAPEPSGASTQQQIRLTDQQQQQQMAALVAAMDSLQRAQAMVKPSSEPSSAQRQEGPSLSSQMLRGQTLPSSAAAAAAAGPPVSGDLQSDAGEQRAQQQQPPLLLQLGPQLSAAVKQTQAIRLLAAVLLAYAALSGWQLGMPAALILIITDISIVAAALLVLHGSSAGKKLVAAQQQQAAAADDVQMPMRLRRFDFLTLVPGLPELLTALSGYRQLANALSEDTAAYLVTMGLLVTTLAVQPPLVKVLS